MRATGAQIIVKLLERQGVETLAGIPGGASLPIYDALWSSPIRHVLARHEQGAGFIAQGMARVTGRAAVCTGTSGPGAANLLTAIADAKLDSVPLVAITGQVPTHMIGTDAFQEVDTYSLTLPIAKHNFALRDAAELLKLVPEAFAVAESGRPGPVVLDVPKDVQQQSVDFDRWPDPWSRRAPDPCSTDGIEQLAEWIDAAERPVIYAGGGVLAAGAAAKLAQLARRASIPVTLTLNGLGAFPPADPLCLGMLGMHGAPSTNWVLEEADLLIAIGARFDDRATGRPDQFCRHAKKAHIDVDRAELGKIVSVDLGLVGDAGEALCALLPRVARRSRRAWLERVAALRVRHPAPAHAEADSRSPGPHALIDAIARTLGPDAIVTTDVGQHQMWVAQSYPVERPRRLLTSGGLGTMGFGLPAAIGAALAEPGTRVACISGDGSILMNIQELATLAELDCEVKVIVLNNRHLGLVRQQQELFYGGRTSAAAFERTPDLAQIARGFGVPGVDLNAVDDVASALVDALREPGPALIDVHIEDVANVYPMVPPGAANRDMICGPTDG